MAHYLVELYSANAAWRALPTANRERFLAGVHAGMGGLSSLGIEVLALGEADADIDHASGHRYLGVWRFPNTTARDVLLAGIRDSGWYDYFDHVNAACDAGGLADHLAVLATA
ncbi:DUF6616 family protein [Luteimonas sp. TWI1416]|uniref:DUF6616 family protein n=1 Tax=unclassified Luteimonas TaxID=2629088 RepID=UPI003207E9F5